MTSGKSTELSSTAEFAEEVVSKPSVTTNWQVMVCGELHRNRFMLFKESSVFMDLEANANGRNRTPILLAIV